VDGGREYRVTDDPADDAEPLWSPDGRYLAFISNRSGSFALWAVAMKGGEPAGAPFKMKDGMREVPLLTWTSRGIVYRQDTHTYNVLTSDRDPSAGGKWSAPAPLAYPRSGRNMAAAWSPDGTQLAFVESAQTQWDRRYAVLQPAAGGSTREFLIPTAQDGAPDAVNVLRWFGNGQGLGFVGTDSNGARVIFRLTLATGEWQVLPAPFKGNRRIEWNDDGSAFYYVRFEEAPQPGIWEYDVRTGSERVIYAPNEPFTAIGSMRVSGNRQWLGFIQQSFLEGGATAVKATAMVLNLKTGERRTLASTRHIPTNLDEPWLRGYTWTPQDSALALLILMRAKREFQIRLAPLDGSPVRVLDELRLPPRTSEIISVDWSSDGRHVAFSVVQAPSEAFVIENPLADAPAAARTVRR
jgi:Tol biopolymer transport system component